MMSAANEDSERPQGSTRHFPLYLNIDTFSHYQLIMNPEQVIEENKRKMFI